MGMFDINAQDKTATLLTDSGAFNTSTLAQVGRGVARLLSLPIQNEANPRASLSHYANGFVYISSFVVEQPQLFEAVVRATGTKKEDWKVQHSDIARKIKIGQDGMARGDMMAGAALMYAMYMGKDMGGNYEDKAAEDRIILSLEEENIDEVVKRALTTD